MLFFNRMQDFYEKNKKGPRLRAFFSYQLLVTSCQLFFSTINCQLSTINCQLFLRELQGCLTEACHVEAGREFAHVDFFSAVGDDCLH